MKRLILLLAGLLAIFSLSACNSFDCDQTETSDEAYICIGIDGVSTARTIAPTFNVAELSGFSLYGRKTAEDDWTSFMWYNNTYEDLLNSTVAIKTGTWYEFKLTAYSNKGHGTTYFIGTISNKEIMKGKNTLNFTLTLDEERNGNSGSGYVNVTFKIPSATAVKKAKAGLYKLDSDVYSTPQTLSITPSEDSDTATAVYSYGGSISKGSYRLKAWFYADEECTLLLSTFSELVKVLGSSTSEAERDIGKLNTVYTITLNNASYKENFTPKTLYTRYEGVTLPKSEEMFKSGYTFMGWYTNAEGSGEPITEIPSTQAENVVLYAKWLEGYWLTADTWEIYSRRGFDGLEEISIYLVGEWTNENFSKFLHGSSELRDKKKSISLDMSQMTGITKIQNLYNPTALVSVKLPASVTSIGDEAFKECSSLKSIELPESLTSIGKNAFEWCKSLENIDLPESLTSIGERVFNGCSSLKNIELPQGLMSIGDSAFCGCAFETLTIPDSVMSIGTYAFFGSSSLKSIVLPRGLKKIEENLFACCYSLENIRWPTALVSIEPQAFLQCDSLKSIELPASLQTIKSGAFLECDSLKSVKFPSNSNLMDIGDSAFMNCKSLESIKIPDKVKNINQKAFGWCPALKDVNLGKCAWINTMAFYGCTSLSEITIPATVNRIGREAFVDSGLKNVYFEATNVKWYITRATDSNYNYYDDTPYTGGAPVKNVFTYDKVFGGTNPKDNALCLTFYFGSDIKCYLYSEKYTPQSNN